jgi:hypothetical protein
MNNYLYIVATTATNGMDNHVPYVVVKIDPETLPDKIAQIQETLARLRAASISYWAGDDVEVEWMRSLPEGWPSKKDRERLLAEDYVVTTTPPPDAVEFARVDASMVTFWDTSCSVRCEARHSDEWYEGAVMFYSDLHRLVNGPQVKHRKKREEA